MTTSNRIWDAATGSRRRLFKLMARPQESQIQHKEINAFLNHTAILCRIIFEVDEGLLKSAKNNSKQTVTWF
jgi:hypothetical protein